MSEVPARPARRFALIGRLIPPVLLIVAVYVLWRELHTLSLDQVLSQMADWGTFRIAAVLALTVIGYLLLGLNEAMALRWAGAKVALKESLLVSFLAYAFANNLGLNILVAGAVRSRAHARSGVPVATVAVATVYCSLAFTLGLCVLAGASFLTAEPEVFEALHIELRTGRIAGWLFLGYPAAYLIACVVWRRPIGMRGRTWVLPSLPWALCQIALGLIDNLVIAAVLWLLLAGEGPSYVDFASAYSTSMVAGLLSNVPGGVGVFESVMLTLLPHTDRAVLAAAFIGYRLIYFLLPLIIAFLVMAFRERALARAVLAGFRRKG